MEVLAAATTVFALCNHILTWIDQLAEKEVLLEDVSSSILQIRNILSQFTSSTFDGIGGQLSESISGVGDALRRIDEHLHLYNSKTTQKVFAFLKPDAFIQRIKVDQKQLNAQLKYLQLASTMAVMDHVWDHNQALVALTKFWMLIVHLWGCCHCRRSRVLEGLHRDKGNSIHHFCVLASLIFDLPQVDIAANDLFCAWLLSWCHGDLIKKICDLIIMQLDEFNSGVVTLRNLARALGKESLKTFVKTYKRSEISL